MTVIGPGLRVKCIDDSQWSKAESLLRGGPAQGTVWTVLKVWPKGSPVGVEGRRGITLVEMITLVEWSDSRDAFNPDYFTPLDDDSVDISALTGALNKGPVEVEHDQRVRVVERVR